MKRSIITGVGRFIPERVVTNFDLEKMMDTSDAWIRERTGIIERHFANEEDTTSLMGARAAEEALKMAGLKADQIDFIIFATLSPEYYFPGSGCSMQAHLGIPGVGAMDIRNQCSGFIYSLATADQFIKTGMYNRILIVGSEKHSSGLNLTTEGRDVAVLFGDGAGAVVLEGTDESDRGIIASRLHADGQYVKELWVENPGSNSQPFTNHEMIEDRSIYPKMNGRYVFKHAVTNFPAVINEVLMESGFSAQDLNLVIPHQANERITEAVQARLELPREKVFRNIHKYGNTTAASIPIALSEALDQGLINKGDLVCLAAFGSGFTWAASLLRW